MFSEPDLAKIPALNVRCAPQWSQRLRLEDAPMTELVCKTGLTSAQRPTHEVAPDDAMSYERCHTVTYCGPEVQSTCWVKSIADDRLIDDAHLKETAWNDKAFDRRSPQ